MSDFDEAAAMREYARNETKDALRYVFEQYYQPKYKDENAAKLAFVCDLADYISFYMQPEVKE